MDMFFLDIKGINIVIVSVLIFLFCIMVSMLYLMFKKEKPKTSIENKIFIERKITDSAENEKGSFENNPVNPRRSVDLTRYRRP